ncbi:hypothetical protein ACPUYX_00010 [Desulfosporosinus sp. SYSU MS00001]|uniref:hypothetical protein n=1 Tax=Desulfosporosinus sp. SYSU MS00001 TaxID=3416284 RepID=UPI003CFB4079
MVYQVCALVATIILGMLGIELILWIRSMRKLTDEVQQTIHHVNTHAPSVFSDVKVITNLIRSTLEDVYGSVGEVAASLYKLKKDPLFFLTAIIEKLKLILSLWQDFRGNKKNEHT